MSTYESTRTAFPARIGRRHRVSGAGLLDRARLLLRAWRKRARDRSELALMSDSGLRDIGASSATVELELQRSFWQRPLRTRR